MKGIKLPDRHPLTWMTDLLIGKVCSKDQKAFLICGAWSLWAGEMDAHMARNSGGGEGSCLVCRRDGGGAPLHESRVKFTKSNI